MNSAELSLPKTLTDYDAYFNPGLTLNRTERVEDTASLTSFGESNDALPLATRIET